MENDLATRLRLWARDIQLHRSVLGADTDILKAADTIERQDAEIAALQARVAELWKAASNIIDHTERYEGQDRFTIAKWQMDALEGAVSKHPNGDDDGQVR